MDVQIHGPTSNGFEIVDPNIDMGSMFNEIMRTALYTQRRDPSYCPSNELREATYVNIAGGGYVEFGKVPISIRSMSPFQRQFMKVFNWLYSQDGFQKYCRTPIIGVFIGILPAGKQVYEHIDEKAVLGVDRYTLCVSGSYDFIFEGTEHHIEPGMMFRFDNSRMHSTINRGDIDRIALIIDCYGEGR